MQSAITPDWSRVRNVLFVRLRSIGDTVLMTACLEAVRQCQPAASISVISEPLAAPVLENHPLIDQLFVVEGDFWPRAKLVYRLRRSHFDVAFNLHGGTTATILTRLSGARHTVGFGDYRGSWMLNRRAPAPNVILGKERLHSVEQQLALLHFAGVPLPQSPRLSLGGSENALASVKKRLRATGIDAGGQGFAVIAPAAAFASKQWAESKFAAITDHLAEVYRLPSVLIAGPGQESVAGRVANLSDAHPRIITGLSLKELAALISLSGLFVGNDSGPMHIAAAFARPVVAIFGSSNPEVWHPWTPAPHRVIQASEALDAETRITQISEEEVVNAIDEVMEEEKAKGKRQSAKGKNYARN